tara:strand:- start:492 stop:1307 length:816 start_codon:yes stop_codon:yes gene_type:complete
MDQLNFIVTGSSGYIGSNFIQQYPKSFILKKDKKGTISISQDGSTIQTISGPCVLIHLATYFSLEEDDKDLIREANLDYGREVLNFVENLDLKKIVYTNSMYNFYEQDKERESYYTKTKKQFSNFLNDYCEKNSISFEEIYLDNTYGNIDKRKKVIPLIIKNIINEKSNPLKNPDNLINLMHVNDVVEKLQIAAKNKESRVSYFVNKKSIQIGSIFEYLFEYKKTQKSNENKLIFHENEYINIKNFVIDYEDIEIKEISNGLLETYLEYAN